MPLCDARCFGRIRRLSILCALFGILLASSHLSLAQAPSQPPATTPSPQQTPNSTAIFSALGDDDLAKATAIIEANPDAVNAKNDQGMTPLAEIANLQHFAVTMNSTGNGTGKDVTPTSTVPPVAALLIAKGADVNAKCNLGSNTGVTPLILALARDKPALAKLLVQHAADVNAAINGGTSPLHFAAGRGDLDMTKMLVGAGANIRMKDGDGQTPLFSAAQFGHAAIVEFLLQKGADVNARDAQGRTPLKFANTVGARYMGHDEVVALLQKNGGIE
jgi:ankyrin repeat protein